MSMEIISQPKLCFCVEMEIWVGFMFFHVQRQSDEKKVNEWTATSSWTKYCLLISYFLNDRFPLAGAPSSLADAVEN